jgi:hypothetical protein
MGLAAKSGALGFLPMEVVSIEDMVAETIKRFHDST